MTVKTKINKQVNFFELCGLIAFIYIALWVIVPIIRAVANEGVFRVIFAFSIASSWILFWLGRKKLYKVDFTFALLCGLYTLIKLLDIIFARGDMVVTDLINHFVLFTSMFVGLKLSQIKNRKLDKILITIFITAYIVSLFTTYQGLLRNTSAVRMLASSSTSESMDAYLLMNNIGGYDFLYGTILMFPAGALIFRNSTNNRVRIICAIWTVLALLTIVRANFTIAYILLLVMMGFILLPNKWSTRKRTLTYLFIIIFSFIAARSIFVFVFDYIAQHTDSILTAGRMESIIGFLNGNRDLSEVNGRYDLIMNSLRGFLSNPFIGIGSYYRNYSVIGGHSTWLDELGRHGLIGIAIVAGLLRTFYAQVIRSLKNKNAKKYVGTVMLFYILLGFINLTYGYAISVLVFSILPTMVRYLSSDYL